jgi:hypothetical protein
MTPLLRKRRSAKMMQFAGADSRAPELFGCRRSKRKEAFPLAIPPRDPSTEEDTMAYGQNGRHSELVEACSRLKQELSRVQCAVLDLHEAFLELNEAEREVVRRQADQLFFRLRLGARDLPR